jgi:hypothetical protein
MTEDQDERRVPAEQEESPGEERFPELAALEEKIQRRLRSNQRFLERFMDEDFDDLEDDDPELFLDGDEPEQEEEL